jgi:hypothetical protein
MLEGKTNADCGFDGAVVCLDWVSKLSVDESVNQETECRTYGGDSCPSLAGC